MWKITQITAETDVLISAGGGGRGVQGGAKGGGPITSPTLLLFLGGERLWSICGRKEKGAQSFFFNTKTCGSGYL